MIDARPRHCVAVHLLSRYVTDSTFHAQLTHTICVVTDYAA